MWHKKLGGSMQLSKYGLVLLCVSFGCFASEQPIVDQNIKSKALALLTDGLSEALTDGLSEALEECSENQARLIVDLDAQVCAHGKISLDERQKWMMTHMPHDLKKVVKIKYHLIVEEHERLVLAGEHPLPICIRFCADCILL